jgi:Zn-finger nucleic acid-binding protein/catechol 2,3-dioxygenase-like lactoylglutathione lyase family enzyme
MLSHARVVPFLATTDGKRARAFYEGVLGLPVLSDDDFAVVVQSGASTIRIAKVKEKAKAPYTVLGWEVNDAHAAVAELGKRGVTFARYEPLEQDDAGVWVAPGGARVAWFEDPDGNVLSVSSMPGVAVSVPTGIAAGVAGYAAVAAQQPAGVGHHHALCPRCAKPLVWMTTRRFGAHVCLKCQGMWVERVTWEHVVRLTEQTGRAGLPQPPARELQRGQPAVACLVCGATCERLLSWAGAVEVDICRPHGLWFDRDELHAVLEDIAHTTATVKNRAAVGGTELSPSQAVDVGIGEGMVEVGRGGGEPSTTPPSLGDEPRTDPDVQPVVSDAHHAGHAEAAAAPVHDSGGGVAPEGAPTHGSSPRSDENS